MDTYVKYNGTADVRVITAKQLMGAGVSEKDAKDISWDASNDFQVARSELDFLDEGQFATLIEADPGFSLVEREDANGPEVSGQTTGQIDQPTDSRGEVRLEDL